MNIFLRSGLLLLLSVYGIQSGAQNQPVYNSADIYLQLKKLNVLGSVLYFAAHPDDENTRLLAYLAKEKQYRTGYLSLTRGDGGQNLIGDEQGIELGLIRTQELLAARRIDGPEQFFSRAFDFGYCKTADEALKTWDHDKILSDAVWVIRRFQPDVIITRFPGDARAGHGHHWASALLAKEAFYAAADSTKFPEQFKYGVHTWQAKRLLWNTFNFGGNNTTDSTQFKMDIGAFNPLLGKGYGEIASESRSQHKSQGFGVPAQRGEAVEYFKLIAGDTMHNDLIDGVNTSWERAEEGGVEQRLTDNIIKSYNFEHPENSVDSLVELYRQVEHAKENNNWTNKKLAEIQQLIIACSGIFAEATANGEYAITGDSMHINFFVNKRNNAKVELSGISLNSFDSTLNVQLPLNRNFSFNKILPVAGNKEITQPYWLASGFNGGSFTVADQLLIGRPENAAAYNAQFAFTINHNSFFVTRPVQFKYTDPVKGELYQPFIVITPMIVSLMPNVVLTNIKPGNTATENPLIHIQFKSNFAAPNVPVHIIVNQDASQVYTKDTIVNFETGATYSTTVPVKKVYAKDLSNRLTVDVIITLNGHKLAYSHYLREIKYDHIPDIHYFYRDAVKVVPDEIKTVGKKIGYLTGAGDKVPQSLQQMGYEVKLLNDADITNENLKQYDAIIAGVRAYDVNAYLTSKYDVLMQYIKNGGNLIVQYNRSEQINNGSIKISPYPFYISSTRVTDEKAEVHVLLPAHSALNYPNKITAKDFEGWIQERSTYQATQPDAHYKAPLGMHDANDPETNGSLVIAAYGKGNFVYTGLVFFRELPAGVAGAYRLMANLIALPQNK